MAVFNTDDYLLKYTFSLCQGERVRAHKINLDHSHSLTSPTNVDSS